MNRIFIAFIALFFGACVAQLSDVYPNGAPAEVGDVVFIKSFNDQSVAGWSKTSLTASNNILSQSNFVTGYQNKKAFKISATTTSNGKSDMITTNFGNPNFIEGTTIRFSALVKANNVVASSPVNPVGGVLIRLDIEKWPRPGYDSETQSVQIKTGVYGTFDWTKLERDWVVVGSLKAINVTVGLFSATGIVYFDSVSVAVVASLPIIPANLLWNLTTRCSSYGPGVSYPEISCQTENVPAGYILPNSFQIRIGNGPFGAQVPASTCRVSYLTGAPTSGICNAYSPNINGDVEHSVYVRNYITQNWVLTKSTIYTRWQGV